MAVRRGGYVGGVGRRIHVLKFRASADLDSTIRKMAENREVTIASVVRELVQRGLEETCGSERHALHLVNNALGTRNGEGRSHRASECSEWAADTYAVK